ncbi:Gfo/Idh/MocA family oxidoreductase [Spiractinospora alimapuensis]|uniref:Gfo/Idh/MocA family protein n=1 Tax=Spiractinospora alimapuensis TaxID=2820884 RepID=UPI001F28F0D8|nr:Gfo/Idh/MocA family oxidoreductase [Spiractinospora alimapuensis]QVQ53359.1 Gfo/Idh/MocA family oxidoreductase [Spiractinospora alimapuensis]
MDDRVLGVAMNGVTGRMGYRQHLVRSILAIRADGGVPLPDGTRVIPEPVLVGRSERKLRAIAEQHGVERWTTDLDSVLSDPSVHVYFDSQVTNVREDAVRRAVAAGKHIYAEKPVADTEAAALELARLVEDAGLKSGVVQDKLFLPGLRKLRRLVDGGFFGRILSVRGEFGYWVFEGDWQDAQRPSWNYRAEDGGGIVLDMFPHWNYVLEHIFAPVSAVTARMATHVPDRVGEDGSAYAATADDAAYAILELANGTIAQINSSWCVRVNRDELVEFQVDGTLGSAVAGLRECRAQSRATTPRCAWDPDRAEAQPYRQQWQTVPDNGEFTNGFRRQWELFLAHLFTDESFPYDFRAGARGLRLAEAAQRSSAEGRRVEIASGE